MSERDRLLALVPDAPVTIEARAMLLAPEDEVELYAADDPAGFVAMDRRLCLGTCWGKIEPQWLEEVRDALPENSSILACVDNVKTVAPILEDWRKEWAILHSRPREIESGREAGMDPSQVRKLTLADLDGIDSREIEEIELLRTIVERGGDVASSFDGEKPVSFCCAAVTTETRWDIGIETAESHRRRGHAMRAYRWMADYQARLGRQPVWGATESNTASRNLAAKLGFMPVGGLWVFERG